MRSLARASVHTAAPAAMADGAARELEAIYRESLRLARDLEGKRVSAARAAVLYGHAYGYACALSIVATDDARREGWWRSAEAADEHTRALLDVAEATGAGGAGPGRRRA